MSEQLDRFISLLKGIFELDKSDLDFGIYRIMNIRKKEIEKFLAEGLPARVKDALAPFAGNTSDIEKRIAEIEKQCDTVGIEVANSKMAGEYNELKATLAKGVDLSGLEADVYSQLYSFFNRYYEEGDFISKRRYKEGVYAIPYEGEEVKLYWANQDQYYIKTSENFKDYTFVAEGYNIHFRLVDATTEQNNNKESKDNKRVFMLYAEDPEHPELKTFEFDAEKKELIIRFVFDIPEDKKAKYEELNDKAITTWLIGNCQELVTVLLVNISSDPKKKQNLLQKHLRSYVTKNTFDYFIHKDLKKFLSRELDFFIKNEVMHLDDVDTTDEKRVDTWLAKVRAIKRVGHVIIDFLASIEDFQKKLWLKKKFVVQCDYCITLDRIPERFYKEIWSNEAQLREWQSLGFISDLNWDYKNANFKFNNEWYEVRLKESSVEIVKLPAAQSISINTQLPLPANESFAYLLVDTKFFNQSFKEQLFSCFEKLNNVFDGVVICSDNFQALSLLQKQNMESFGAIYIDPPYNTDASKIIYKNNYEHSSWLALMHDRLQIGKKFLKKSGIQATAIDEYELKELYSLLQDLFRRENNAGIIAVRSNPSGRPRDGGLALSHEYTIVSKNSTEASIAKVGRSDEQAARYDKKDEFGFYEQRNFRREGSNSDRADGKRQWYPIYVNKDSLAIRVPNMVWDENTELWQILEPHHNDEEVIYPITDEGREKNWRWSWENVKKDYSQFYAILQKSGFQVYYKFRPSDDGVSPLTFWDDKKYSAVEYGTKLLKDILPNNPFKYPKSLYAVMDMLMICGVKNGVGKVLDYFAGSATTAHAVIELNRQDKGKRVYTLVDMGEYFSAVTLPRIKKVVFAQKWKDGKPQAAAPVKLKQQIHHKEVVERDSDGNELTLSFDVGLDKQTLVPNENFQISNPYNGISHCFKYMRLESYEDALSNVELPEDKSVERMVSLFGDEYLIKYMLDLDTAGSVLNLAAFNDPFDYKLKVTEKNETKEVNADLMETFNYLIGLTVDKMYARKIFSASPDPAGEYEGAVKLTGNDNGEYIFRQIEGTLPSGERALIIWRNITDNLLESNAALDAYFQRYRINPADREYDVIYVNGDNNIANLKSTEETWKVRMIEPEFKTRMFEEE